jgi:hypothetical protein
MKKETPQGEFVANARHALLSTSDKAASVQASALMRLAANLSMLEQEEKAQGKHSKRGPNPPSRDGRYAAGSSAGLSRDRRSEKAMDQPCNARLKTYGTATHTLARLKRADG